MENHPLQSRQITWEEDPCMLENWCGLTVTDGDPDLTFDGGKLREIFRTRQHVFSDYTVTAPNMCKADPLGDASSPN